MSAVRISGPLARDAVCRKSAADRPENVLSWLCVEVAQPDDGLHCHAAWLLGAGPAAAIAGDANARRLRRGARVVVHAAGWHISDTPSPHLVLREVDFIEHPAAPAYHEPRAPQHHAQNYAVRTSSNPLESQP
jgi:hypothetical protein